MRKTEKAARGQTIITETAGDRSSYKQDDNEALMGRKMAGGPLDLSSSLGGGSPEKDVNYMDKAAKPRPN